MLAWMLYVIMVSLLLSVGAFLAEHRRSPHRRKVVAQLLGVETLASERR